MYLMFRPILKSSILCYKINKLTYLLTWLLAAITVLWDVGRCAMRAVIYYCQGVALTSGFYQRHRGRHHCRHYTTGSSSSSSGSSSGGKPRSGGTVGDTSHDHLSPILLRAMLLGGRDVDSDLRAACSIDSDH